MKKSESERGVDMEEVLACCRASVLSCACSDALMARNEIDVHAGGERRELDIAIKRRSLAEQGFPKKRGETGSIDGMTSVTRVPTCVLIVLG